MLLVNNWRIILSLSDKALYRIANYLKLAETLQVLRFTRFDSFDNAEYFLVERKGIYYVLYYASGGNLSFGILVRGEDLSIVEQEYDLAIDNELKQTGAGTGTGEGFSGKLSISSTEMDETAEQHLNIFDHPTFGVKWETGEEASENIDEKVVQQFDELLKTQLRNWKGSSNGLNVTKHQYWQEFQTMVQAAIQEQYGDQFVLYRGIHGEQAEELLGGGPLKLSPYSSWTIDYDMSLNFRGQSGEKWVVVGKEFGPIEIALAPVEVPEYIDPEVLLSLGSDVQSAGSEFIVFSSTKEIPVGEFEIVYKTRAK